MIETLGQRIKEQRKALKLTQVDLARKMQGVSHAAISQWENDTTKPNAENLLDRTGSDSSYRLAFPAVFGGEVKAGRDYLILDDNSTMGGTIAGLKGYIENRGGKVIGAAVMSARATGLEGTVANSRW